MNILSAIALMAFLTHPYPAIDPNNPHDQWNEGSDLVWLADAANIARSDINSNLTECNQY